MHSAPVRLSVLPLGAILAVLLCAAPASAATITVNDDSTGPGACATTTVHSIQDGIDAATAGDTLDVCAGTYSEAGGAPAASVDKQLIIRGPQAGVDARIARTGAEAVVDDADGGFGLTGAGAGSTVDGFTVSGATAGLGAGISVLGGDDFRILNNIVTGNTIGISVASDGPKDTLIRQNLIQDNNEAGAASGSGIYGDADVEAVNIDRNKFAQQTNAAVIFVGPDNNDIAVTRNELGDSPIFLQNSHGVDIVGNSNSAPQNHGVQLDGGNTTVDIHDNAFTANNDQWSAIRVSDSGVIGDNENVDIRGNNLAGPSGGAGALGINVSAYDGNLDASYNRIVGFTQGGINNNDPSTDIDARNNWWGCNEGPTDPDCDDVTGANAAGVDSTPFLVLSAAADPAAIQTGASGSTITADLTHNSAGREVEPEFPDGVPVGFATNLGALSAATAATDGGSAESVLTSQTAGTATVTASLDAATAAADVVITTSPPPPPPPSLKLTLNGPSTQKPKKLRVQATCSAACSLRAKATGKSRGKTFNSRTVSRDLAANAPTRVALPFKKNQLKKANKAKRLRVNGTATASGNRSASESLKINVK